MDRERYWRLKEIFLAADELPADERERYLAATCAEDPALLAEARALLAAAQPTGTGLLEPPTMPPLPADTGDEVAHYRIVELLGTGGMGVVYRAEDSRLPRTVALKLLQPELTRSPAARQRLLREARAVAALDHPNVCTIFEVGETTEGRTFLAMACYDGETLAQRLQRGPLPAAEAVEIAAQIAAGLEHAHERGIVHRDLKPANVMLTREGLVKVLDFGIAKLVDETRLTATGAAFGTPTYMSPEQIRSAAVDARSDVWSLGVLLYEMVAGEPPFGVDDPQAMFYSILHVDPAPLDARVPGLPRGLAAVVARALDKDPGERQADMGEVRQELARVGTDTAPTMRLQPQKARAKRWPSAAAVALLAMAALAVQAPQPPAGLATQSVEAERLYVKGKYLYDRGEFVRAQDFFARAVAEDPQFALAHAGLSRATVYLGFLGGEPPAQAYPAAAAAAERALSLQDDLAEGHLALALLRFFSRLDWDGAEEAARRAIELDPKLAEAHYVYGVLSINRGRLDRGLRELGRALERDPVVAKIYYQMAKGHLYRRDYRRTLALVRQSEELIPARPMVAELLVSAHWQLGNRRQAAEAAAPLRGLREVLAHLAAGRQREAHELVDGWSAARRGGATAELPGGATIANAYALLGDREHTLDWLERAYAEPGGRLGFTQYYQSPEYDLVRDDPRFRALLARTGLDTR